MNPQTGRLETVEAVGLEVVLETGNLEAVLGTVNLNLETVVEIVNSVVEIVNLEAVEGCPHPQSPIGHQLLHPLLGLHQEALGVPGQAHHTYHSQSQLLGHLDGSEVQ